MTRVRVNRDFCAGTGLCTTICPTVFELDDGFSRVVVDSIDETDDPLVREAVRLCPTSALELDPD